MCDKNWIEQHGWIVQEDKFGWKNKVTKQGWKPSKLMHYFECTVYSTKPSEKENE